MEYAFDYYFDYDDSPTGVEFVYNDNRHFSKLYLLSKSIGLIVYIITLSTCDALEVYVFMLSIMGLSVVNTARYEYKQYEKYGTVFYSVSDYESWKLSLWPRSRLLFSIVELVIKIWFIIKFYPPRFYFQTLCDTGQSILYVHIIIIFIIYILASIHSVGILLFLYYYEFIQTHSLQNNIFVENEEEVSNSRIVQLSVSLISCGNSYEDCCICLDNECIQSWSYLPCGHKFHASCVSIWVDTHHTCPVCRYDIRSNSV